MMKSKMKSKGVASVAELRDLCAQEAEVKADRLPDDGRPFRHAT